MGTQTLYRETHRLRRILGGGGSTVLVGLNLLISEVSGSNSDKIHSAGHLCTSDQPDAETST